MSNPQTHPTVEKLIEDAADANGAKWIVTYGDAFEGIGSVGPFESYSAAISYATRVFGNGSAWSGAFAN